jgi:hypothetical protein
MWARLGGPKSMGGLKSKLLRLKANNCFRFSVIEIEILAFPGGFSAG